MYEIFVNNPQIQISNIIEVVFLELELIGKEWLITSSYCPDTSHLLQLPKL